MAGDRRAGAREGDDIRRRITEGAGAGAVRARQRREHARMIGGGGPGFAVENGGERLAQSMAATDAAFSSADRVTFFGSRSPRAWWR